jgi:hypothetical protein
MSQEPDVEEMIHGSLPDYGDLCQRCTQVEPCGLEPTFGVWWCGAFDTPNQWQAMRNKTMQELAEEIAENIKQK